jgi:hypothetical protein
VKRLLSPLLVLSLLLLSTGCGKVFIRGAIEAGSTIQGSVSLVQLGNALSGMETVQVTFVTLLQNGISSTIGFCGNQTTLFPLNQTVRVTFNPGQPCATVLAVVIVV